MRRNCFLDGCLRAIFRKSNPYLPLTQCHKLAVRSWKIDYESKLKYSRNTVCGSANIYWQSNTDEPTRCNSDLLICKISSTCFGQYFAHHQERETEIFTAYGILLLWWQGDGVPCCRSPSPCPPQQQDTICCKNLSLTLLMMGKILPETCWADLIDQ